MPYVADLVAEPFIRAYSEPLDYSQGVALADRGEVQFLQRLPVWVTAVVTGEHAQLHAAHAHLRWECTCREAEGGRMCRHVVALAHEVGRRPQRQERRGKLRRANRPPTMPLLARQLLEAAERAAGTECDIDRVTGSPDDWCAREYLGTHVPPAV